MSERGTSESTQWSLLVPALMALVLGLIQTGIWLHGRSVVSDAALAVAQEVSWSRADDAAAAALGRRVAGAGGVTGVGVSIVRRSGLVEVRVSAQVPIFFDVGQGRVSEVAVLPLERDR